VLELCTNFQIEYENMSDKEAKYFHEAWTHFHNVMTQSNGQTVQNCLYLNENFMELWNNNTPPEMLKICLSYSVELISLQSPDRDENFL